MFTNDRIKLLHFQFVWTISLILSRRVIVTSTRTRFQLNKISHNFPQYLHFLTSFSEVSQNSIDSFFINDPHALRRNPQFYITLFTLYPKAMVMKVWQKPSSTLVLSMRDVVSSHRAFTCNLTNLCHKNSTN